MGAVATSSKCVLVAANTPLFAHLWYAKENYFRGTPAEGIEVEAYGHPHHGIDDELVATMVGKHYERHYVLVAACDPYAARNSNLRIVAAIVKRLGLIALLPTVPRSGEKQNPWDILEKTTTISVPGPEQSRNSARALAENIKALINALRPSDDDVSQKGDETLETKSKACKIDDHAYDSTPTPRNGELVITSNFVRALALESSSVAAYAVTELFPEWSRLFLTALLAPVVVSREEDGQIKALVTALNRACYDLHFGMSRQEIAQFLKRAYWNQQMTDDVAHRLAMMLLENRLVPYDVRPSRLATLMNQGLWEKMLSDALLRPHRFSRDALIRYEAVKGYPSSDLELSSEAYRVAREAVSLMARDIVTDLCRNFSKYLRSMAERHGERPPFIDLGTIKDEYDVQDLMRALLRLHFEDVRSEEWTPSYAGKSTRMDFLLKRERIAVEVKTTLTREQRNHVDKEIGDELVEDREHYQAHQDCGILVCFIYDPERKLRNVGMLKSEVATIRSGFRCIVEVHPES